MRIDAGDTDLDRHLKTCSKRATYLSKTIQNELLQCIREVIQAEIVHDIQSQSNDISSFYGIQADEVTDISNWEQLGIVFRYIKNKEPVERLLEFVDCESVTGENICAVILKVIRSHGLQPNLCRAQMYDGAGNMAGQLRGCASRFLKEVPQATYYHCASHQLNLAISKTTKVNEIQSMLSVLTSVGLFYNILRNVNDNWKSPLKHTIVSYKIPLEL